MPLKLVFTDKEYAVENQTYKVGRAPNCDIVLQDGMVSSNHCLFSNGRVQDLDSSNGTKIDGRDMKPGVRYPLKVGQCIEIGQTKMFVRSGHATGPANQDLMRSKRFGAGELKGDAKEEFVDPDAHLTVKEVMDREFDLIIGHPTLKDQLRAFYKKVKLDEIRASNGKLVDQSRLYHMVFQGPPGTGKTTMANLVAKLMRKMKLVSSDKVVFVNNPLELLAGYRGQTPAKVNAKVAEAEGGVLFIDEAYSIVKSQESQQDSFGKEAIETVMKHLDPPSCVFIFAGYEKEMKDFLDVNAGLSRRVPYRYTFNPYSVDQLVQITIKMCEGKGEKIDAEVLKNLPTLIDSVGENTLKTQNAGFIENWISFSQVERDDRLDIQEAKKHPELAFTLHLVDLEKGLDKITANNQ